MRVACRVVATVFHPLLAVCYAVALLMGYDAVLGTLDQGVRWRLVFIVAIDTALVPWLIMRLLRLSGRIAGGAWRDRRSLLSALFAVVIGYLLCLWMLSGVSVAFLIVRVVLAATWCAFTAFALRFFRLRVSFPMWTSGAFCALVALLIAGGYDLMIFPLCGGVLVAGLLGSIGLYAGRFSLSQTGWSFAGGAVVAQVALLFL